MSFEVVGVRLVADGGAQYFGTMDKAEKAVVDYGRTTDRTFKQMPGLADMAVGAFHRIGAVAVDVFMQAGRAAVSFIGDSIGAAGDFESGMNKFAAVAGGALEESGLALKDFRDQFIQIGKELPVSTAEVQDAAIEMVKGGIEPATIAAGGLKQVIQFAAAADLDLAQASTIAAKALGGWVDITATAEEKAGFLTHSTDLLARAANASTVNVDDLALGLYNVQGTAKLAGVSFDETVTALAQLAPSFSSSADAGTSFKTFLARLQPTTKPAIAAMEDLGLYTEATGSAFYDAQGNFVGMEEASRLLAEATKGLTAEQKQQALQTIFGQDAIRTAAVFAEQGADGYNAMTAALEKQNSVAEMAAQKQAGFNTALDNFKGSVEALQITIGSYLLPVLTDLFNNYLAPGINTITAFAESIFAADDPILALTTAIDGMLPGFKSFADTVGIVVPQVLSFIDANWDTIVNALTAVAAAVGTLMAGNLIMGLVGSIGALSAAFTAAGGGMTAVVAILGGPVTIAIGAIALAVGALTLAWTNDWGGIQTTLTDFWKTTGEPIFDEVVTWLGDNIPKAIDVVSDFWERTLLPALTEVWGFLQKNVLPILGVLVNTYFKMVETEIRVLANFWTDMLWPALKDVWGFLDKNILPILGALANVSIAMLKLAIRDLTDIFTTVLLPAITDIYNWFNDNVIPVMEDAGDGADVLAGVLKDTLGPAWSWLGENVLEPAVGWFEDISSAISGAVDWLNDLADTINNLPSLPDPFTGHSPPPIANWMADIALGAAMASSALGSVGDAIRGLPNAGMSLGIASPNTLAMRGAGTTNATYNQQRTTNLTYHTTHAPPANQSLALANALAGGF